MARVYHSIEKGLQITSENGDTGVKILFGSGAPNVAAEVGSLYMRTGTGDLYKKIGAGDSDWEIFPDVTTLNHLITLSGVAADSDDLGTFTGVTIPDNSTIKAALQALETALELIGNEIVYTDEDAITTARVIDSVLVDNILACKWLVVATLDGTAQRKSFEVFAQHNGTASADATATDDTVYAKLLNGAAFNCDVSVALSGSDVTQAMELKVTASSAVSVRATRMVVNA